MASSLSFSLSFYFANITSWWLWLSPATSVKFLLSELNPSSYSFRTGYWWSKSTFSLIPSIYEVPPRLLGVIRFSCVLTSSFRLILTTWGSVFYGLAELCLIFSPTGLLGCALGTGLVCSVWLAGVSWARETPPAGFVVGWIFLRHWVQPINSFIFV